MEDPIFDKAPYLRPIPGMIFRIPKGSALPKSERTRMRRKWEGWLYAVVRDVNPLGVGTIKVYRDGHKVASAPVSDNLEADRLFEETVEAALEATREVEAELGK